MGVQSTFLASLGIAMRWEHMGFSEEIILWDFKLITNASLKKHRIIATILSTCTRTSNEKKASSQGDTTYK